MRRTKGVRAMAWPAFLILLAAAGAASEASSRPSEADWEGRLPPGLPHEQDLVQELFELGNDQEVDFLDMSTSSAVKITVTTLMRDTVKIKHIQASALRTTGLGDMLENVGIAGMNGHIVYCVNFLVTFLKSVISFGMAVVGQKWAVGVGVDKRKHASIYKFAKDLLVRTISSVILLILETSDKVTRLVVTAGGDVAAYFLLFYQWYSGIGKLASCAQGFRYLLQLHAGVSHMKTSCNEVNWAHIIHDRSAAALKVLQDAMVKSGLNSNGKPGNKFSAAQLQEAKDDAEKTAAAFLPATASSDADCIRIGELPRYQRQDAVAGSAKQTQKELNKKMEDFKSKILESKLLTDKALSGACGMAIKLFVKGAAMQAKMANMGWHKCKTGSVAADTTNPWGFTNSGANAAKQMNTDQSTKPTRHLFRCAMFRFFTVLGVVQEWIMDKIRWVKAKILGLDTSKLGTVIPKKWQDAQEKGMDEAVEATSNRMDDTLSALSSDPAEWFEGHHNMVKDERMLGNMEVQERHCLDGAGGKRAKVATTVGLNSDAACGGKNTGFVLRQGFASTEPDEEGWRIIMADYAGEYALQKTGEAHGREGQRARLEYILCDTDRGARLRCSSDSPFALDSERATIQRKTSFRKKVVTEFENKLASSKASQDNGGVQLKEGCDCNFPAIAAAAGKDARRTTGIDSERGHHRHGVRTASCYLKAGFTMDFALRKARWDWRQVFAPSAAQHDKKGAGKKLLAGDAQYTFDSQKWIGKWTKLFSIRGSCLIADAPSESDAATIKAAGYISPLTRSVVTKEDKKRSFQPNFGTPVEFEHTSTIFKEGLGDSISRTAETVWDWHKDATSGYNPSKTIFMVTNFELNPTAYQNSEGTAADATAQEKREAAEKEARKQVTALNEKYTTTTVGGRSRSHVWPTPVNPANAFCINVLKAENVAIICPRDGPKAKGGKACLFGAKTVRDGPKEFRLHEEVLPEDRIVTMCFASLHRARAWACALGLQVRQVSPAFFHEHDRSEVGRKDMQFRMVLGGPAFEADQRGVDAHSGKACKCSKKQANFFGCLSSGEKTRSFTLKVWKWKKGSIGKGDEKDVLYRNCDTCEDCGQGAEAGLRGLTKESIEPWKNKYEEHSGRQQKMFFVNPLDAWCEGSGSLAKADEAIEEIAMKTADAAIHKAGRQVVASQKVLRAMQQFTLQVKNARQKKGDDSSAAAASVPRVLRRTIRAMTELRTESTAADTETATTATELVPKTNARADDSAAGKQIKSDLTAGQASQASQIKCTKKSRDKADQYTDAWCKCSSGGAETKKDGCKQKVNEKQDAVCEWKTAQKVNEKQDEGFCAVIKAGVDQPQKAGASGGQDTSTGGSIGTDGQATTTNAAEDKKSELSSEDNKITPVGADTETTDDAAASVRAGSGAGDGPKKCPKRVGKLASNGCPFSFKNCLLCPGVCEWVAGNCLPFVELTNLGRPFSLDELSNPLFDEVGLEAYGEQGDMQEGNLGMHEFDVVEGARNTKWSTRTSSDSTTD